LFPAPVVVVEIFVHKEGYNSEYIATQDELWRRLTVPTFLAGGGS